MWQKYDIKTCGKTCNIGGLRSSWWYGKNTGIRLRFQYSFKVQNHEIKCSIVENWARKKYSTDRLTPFTVRLHSAVKKGEKHYEVPWDLRGKTIVKSFMRKAKSWPKHLLALNLAFSINAGHKILDSNGERNEYNTRKGSWCLLNSAQEVLNWAEQITTTNLNSRRYIDEGQPNLNFHLDRVHFIPWTAGRRGRSVHSTRSFFWYFKKKGGNRQHLPLQGFSLLIRGIFEIPRQIEVAPPRQFHSLSRDIRKVIWKIWPFGHRLGGAASIYQSYKIKPCLT